MSKFKLAFIVLLIATIAWGITFYHTLQGYRKYIEWLESDECPIKERLSYKYDGIGLWQRWDGVPYIVVVGIFLFVAWICFIGVAPEKLSSSLFPAKV